jgi:hypothetical protein
MYIFIDQCFANKALLAFVVRATFAHGGRRCNEHRRAEQRSAEPAPPLVDETNISNTQSAADRAERRRK